MSSIARSSSAGHAAHGFAKPVAKGEPTGEGFEALIASLAGAIVAPPAQNPREGHADAEGEAGDQRGKSGTVDAALTAALAGVGASNPQDNSPAVLLREMHDAHGIATSPGSR